MVDTFVVPLLKIVVLLNAVLVSVTFLVLMERKVIAWAQSRLGPMRVGPHGILQALADPIKLILKEDITPARADKWVFTIAPIMSLVPALVVFSVVPFGFDPLFYVSDINVGLLFILAVTSIGVYGIILGGWASNSKYPLLSSLRASAQLISYEIAVSITLVSLILTAGTLNLVGIVEAQRDAGIWFGFLQPVALVLVFIGGLAETNRVPVDLPEAETELTGGFHTEYSGMRFSLFFLAEYANIIVISAVVVIMFMGGWMAPFPNVPAFDFFEIIPGWIWFIGKIFVFLYVFIWLRATLPRYRYDQLMNIGWKVLIPIALWNLVVTGIAKDVF